MGCGRSVAEVSLFQPAAAPLVTPSRPAPRIPRRASGISDREGGRGPWLGGFQTNSLDEPAGNWRWVTDEPFRFTNWAAGEPNNAPDGEGGQHEAFLQLLPDGGWNDVDEFGTTPGKFPRGFVAEFDKGRQAACRKAG